MKPIKAVLFDMDGLMIDSEPLHLMAFNRILDKYGKNLTEEENTKRYIGVSDIDAAKDMVVRFDLPISAKRLTKDKQEEYRKLFRTQLVAQPSLIELLNDLKKNSYKTAIASSSTLEEIRMVVEGLKMSSLIDMICSAEEVENGKPAPDVYLLAAKRLNVDSSECLVLEDTPKGVQAGKAAGMNIFAVPSQYTKGQDFRLADKVLNNLSEVFSLINN